MIFRREEKIHRTCYICEKSRSGIAELGVRLFINMTRSSSTFRYRVLRSTVDIKILYLYLPAYSMTIDEMKGHVGIFRSVSVN